MSEGFVGLSDAHSGVPRFVESYGAAHPGGHCVGGMTLFIHRLRWLSGLLAVVAGPVERGLRRLHTVASQLAALTMPYACSKCG